jgi:hypothetical protein
MADWWLLADSPVGWYYYDLSLKKWKPGNNVTHQGQLRDLNLKTVLNTSGLKSGIYNFYFGVDLNMDGKISKKKLYYDQVRVFVNGSLCYSGLYNGLSIDTTQEIFPDETDVALLPLCSQWIRFTGGSPLTAMVSDPPANNGVALEIIDGSHAESCHFWRDLSDLNTIGMGSTVTLNARFKVEAPTGASEFLGGTLGVFIEIDDGVHRIYACLLNQDFDGGADPEIGVAGNGPLNQYNTYLGNIYQVYWDDGAYHHFKLIRHGDGSATLVVDDDTAGAIHVGAGSLQPTSGVQRLSFGSADGGMSVVYWDEISYTLTN